MTENLRWGLYWASRGWQLFPCRWAKPEPKNNQDNPRFTHMPYTSWGSSEGRSSDPRILDSWAKKYPNCYFCVALKASNLSVLDVDNKGRKQGTKTLNDLQLIYGDLPDSIVIHTPGNGFHYFFQDFIRMSVETLGSGIDTPAMVPVPGSFIPGKGVYEIENPAKLTIPSLPQWISDKLNTAKHKQREKDARIPASELDQEYNIQRAVSFASASAPISILGQRGDDTGFEVACYIRDFGLSQEVAEQIMLEHWYPRCEPNDEYDFVRAKVNNAYRYAQNRLGEKDPNLIFPADLPQIVEKPHIKVFGTHTDAYSPKIRREWLIKGFFSKKSTNILFGDTGSMKTFIALDIAMHIVSGFNWCGHRTNHGPVFYFAAEGNDDMPFRIRAWDMHHNIQDKNNPIFYALNPISVGAGPSLTAALEDIKYNIGEIEPKLIILDTLARSLPPGLKESDNTDMSAFLGIVDHCLRIPLNTTILIVHHSGHGEKTKERMRGASSLQGDTDSIFWAERKKEESYHTALHCKKIRNGPLSPTMHFMGRVLVVGEDDEGKPETTLALTHMGGYAEKPEIKENQ